jgi:hypothetical protein
MAHVLASKKGGQFAPELGGQVDRNIHSVERIIKFSVTKDIKIGLSVGILLTLITSISIFDFSKDTFANKTQPVQGEEVVEGVYKFDFPFLGDKLTLENTLKAFEENHPDLKKNYIYTGPDELNSKKKTHMLLYVFTVR